MSDRYSQLVNSPIGSRLAGQLGLPKPAVLRRYQPGAPLLHGPLLLGATSGSTLPPVDGPRGLGALLRGAGIDVTSDAEPDVGRDAAIRPAALVLDATGVATVADLAQVRDFLAGPLRRLLPSGRVIVIGRAPDSADPVADSVRQALDGIVRSLGKELRAGSTANLLAITTALPDEQPASLESALRFLLSGRAAYVDGQPIRLGPGDAPAPADWDQPLAGRVAVVTGAARGIGAAIARVLARDGAHVVAADLPAAGEALARVTNKINGTALQLDIAAADAPRILLEHLAARHGGVDIVVHNAGVTRDKLLANMKPEQWELVLEVNLASQLRINSALLAGQALHHGGRVITLSSTTGFAGNRGQTNYGASKAGVIGMVRSYAAAFAGHGATINGVAPGLIDTDMINTMPLATREVARRLNSLQQAGLPVDVAEAIAWLSSSGAGGVNGQVIRVCGQNLVGA
jgi:3-oxoacyl-[acyl-carrier protein] reductase